MLGMIKIYKIRKVVNANPLNWLGFACISLIVFIPSYSSIQLFLFCVKIFSIRFLSLLHHCILQCFGDNSYTFNDGIPECFELLQMSGNICTRFGLHQHEFCVSSVLAGLACILINSNLHKVSIYKIGTV